MDEKRAAGKQGVVTRKEAREALRNAKKAYGRKSTVKPKAWKKGGNEWSKVLGHFGVTATKRSK